MPHRSHNNGVFIVGDTENLEAILLTLTGK